MLFDKYRSNKKEYLDNFSLQGPELENNLLNLAKCNKYLGVQASLIRTLTQILQKNPQLANQTIKIADLGCGGGDLLIAIAQWGKLHSIHFEMTGFDANPSSIRWAIAHASQYPNIKFENENIFSSHVRSQVFDIAFMSDICHHLKDEEIIKIWQQLKKQTKVAVIICDLHRHWLAYLGIKLLMYFWKSSYLEKHDGPLSVMRGFKRHELTNLLSQVGSSYTLEWQWPFRWNMVIYLWPPPP